MSEAHLPADEADRELIARWKRGDPTAATAIVSRHSDALARFAFNLGERNDVEELVQDTFVRAFGSLHSFRGASALRTWLFTIERRLVLDRRRAAGRAPAVVPVTESSAATEFTALDSMVAAETEQQVREAIEKLSPMQREVFALRVSEGLSYKEIADVIGSTEGAARVHYHNAMRAVKEYLSDE
ncbi:MAG: RNA polymerase sigma factor [Gemmatimonadaceae bacterium]